MLDEAGLSQEVYADSAGTHGSHVGEKPDARVQAAAIKRGYDLSQVTARQITVKDFHDYDMILVMDWENMTALRQICPRKYHHKLMLLMRFSNEYEEATVPNAAHGGPETISRVLDYVEDACQGVLDILRKRITHYQAA